MNKKELIDGIVLDTGKPRAEVEKIVDVVFEKMLENIGAGVEVSIHGFGSFSTKATAARKGRNPKTGESIDIPAGKKLVFKAAKALKDAVI